MIKTTQFRTFLPVLLGGVMLMGVGASADPVVSTSLVDPNIITTGVGVSDTFDVLIEVSSNGTADIPALGVLELQYDSSKLLLQGAEATLPGGDLGQALVGNPVSLGGDDVATWIILYGVLSNTNPTPELVTVTFEVVGAGGPYDVSVVAPQGSSDPRSLGTQPALLNSTTTAPIASATTDSSGTLGIPETASVDDWMLMTY